MKLSNFSLKGSVACIGLEGLGVYWDLHNYASFSRIDYVVNLGKLDLYWTVPDIDDAWGDTSNHFKGCAISFNGLISFKIISTNIKDIEGEKPLESISMISSDNPLSDNEINPNYRVIDKIPINNEYGLLFSFYGGVSIEVFAQTVELRGIV